MAKIEGPCRRQLRTCETASPPRKFRIDLADSARSGLDPRKHCRRSWPEAHRRLRASSLDGAGIAARTRDTHIHHRASRISATRRDSGNPGNDRRGRTHDFGPNPKASRQNELSGSEAESFTRPSPSPLAPIRSVAPRRDSTGQLSTQGTRRRTRRSCWRPTRRPQ